MVKYSKMFDSQFICLEKDIQFSLINNYDFKTFIRCRTKHYRYSCRDCKIACMYSQNCVGVICMVCETISNVDFDNRAI